MQFFVDTANLDDIKSLQSMGLIDGVTTNPSLVLKSGKPFLKLIEDICAVVPGPVSAEVTAADTDGMLAEGRKLANIAPNVIVKVPLTPAGLSACQQLKEEEISCNVTLCFTPMQAVLAAKAGATYVSPFVGRLDDIGQDGTALLQDIRDIYDQYPDFETQILAASLRHPAHVLAAAKIGVDVATCPPDIIRKLFDHPLTEKGLAAFQADWEKTGQSIL